MKRMIEAEVRGRDAGAVQEILLRQGFSFERFPRRGGVDVYRVLIPGEDTGEILRRIRKDVASFRLISVSSSGESGDGEDGARGYRALSKHGGRMTACRLFGIKRASGR